MSMLGALLGRPLANREFNERQIGAFEGVPAMGLDGLGSSAYGPEAALSILIPLGAAGASYIGYVMAPILALLAILYISYQQTIRAYPSNGGAYTVSKENLGVNGSLLAAAALMVDYVLNVAVGISAGVAALVSAIPTLHAYTLQLCLAILAFVTVINLRGTLDAGRLFALPTYIFVGCFLLLLALGCYDVLSTAGHPTAVVAPPAPAQVTEAVGFWILLRAFSSGCTAMTGVEAVSNGVSAFREPKVKYGHRTLGAIVLILALLLAGISYLVHAYGITAMDQTRDGYQSVLSQLASAVVGRNWFYYLALASALAVLALSANTSFTDFPRMCRIVAEDGFLPRSFAVVGRRLVFSIGIIYLAAAAGLLLIAFDGITDRLIPLFAVGAFLTFTMSQTGMVIHWYRELRRSQENRGHNQVSLTINAVGAATTGLASLIIIATKFIEGAWITLLVIPAAIVLLKSIRHYYDDVARQLREDKPLALDHVKSPIILIVAASWNKLTDKALAFALSISPDVYAMHLKAMRGPDRKENEKAFIEQWRKHVEVPAREARLKPPKLLMHEAQYRRLDVPLLAAVRELQEHDRDRVIAVMIPEVVKQGWWQYLLHTHRARRIRAALLRAGGPRLVLMNVPWHLADTDMLDTMEQELRSEADHVKEEMRLAWQQPSSVPGANEQHR